MFRMPKPMLCPAVAGSRIPSHSFPEEVRIPHYEIFCPQLQKLFSRILSLVDYEEGGPLPALR